MRKTYYNKTTKQWYFEGDSMTRAIEHGVFSGVPSEEQLTVWGFEEWVDPIPTLEELLDKVKQNKIEELKTYDTSDNVNAFNIIFNNNTITTWLTPEQRSDYKNSIDAAELLGAEVVHPVFNGIQIELPIQTAKMALARIQLYANQCYNTTEQHKANINALETIEAVEQYDFTVNYPNKLIFEI